MKRFIYVIVMALGMLTMTPQSANAQLRGLLKGAIEKGTQAAKDKKAAKEYNALCDVVNEAIANHDLRFFCAANRREELRRAAAAAEIDNSDMDYKIQKFLSDETDLNNTDYIASARGLLARSKAETDIPTSNYLLKCAKIQYSTELEKVDPETLPLLQEIYDDIIAYENTFTNGRNKGAELVSPSQLIELLAEKKAEEDGSNYEKMDWSTYKDTPTTSSSSSSSSESQSDKNLPGEYPNFYNNYHLWRDKDNNVIALVKTDGSVYHRSKYGSDTEICQIKSNGEILVRGQHWGQVMKGRDFVIYKYDKYSKEYKEIGSVSPYSNGRVEWEHQYMGNAEDIKDKNGNVLVPFDRGNTTFVHRAFAFFLYDKIR